MKYSRYSLNQKSHKKFRSSWEYEKGVFETPRGKWIARVYIIKKGFVTLSSHETKEEAKKAYDDFYAIND